MAKIAGHCGAHDTMLSGLVKVMKRLGVEGCEDERRAPMVPKRLKGSRFNIALVALPVYLIYAASSIYIPYLPANTVVLWGIEFLLSVLLPALLLRLLWTRLNIAPKDYGLSVSGIHPRFAEFFAYVLLCTLAFLTYVIVENVVRSELQLPTEKSLIYSQFPPNAIGYIVAFCIAGSAGFFEEVFYRGILGKIILSDSGGDLNKFAYVITSGVLFGAAHFSLGISMFIGTIYLGVVAAILYVWIRNLWPLVAAHFLTDMVIYIWTVKRAAQLATN